MRDKQRTGETRDGGVKDGEILFGWRGLNGIRSECVRVKVQVRQVRERDETGKVKRGGKEGR